MIGHARSGSWTGCWPGTGSWICSLNGSMRTMCPARSMIPRFAKMSKRQKGQGYLLRLTRTPEEFIEKILILEQGLGDRAIAMMKPFIVGDLVCKGEPEDTRLYFRFVDRGHFLFESFHEGESGGYVSYDMGSFYNWYVTQKLDRPLHDVLIPGRRSS